MTDELDTFDAGPWIWKPAPDPVDPCTSTGCTDTCSPNCATGVCSVGRKHFRRGGVCCATCFTSCADCGDAFYWENVHYLGEDAQGGRCLCHCCMIRLRRSGL